MSLMARPRWTRQPQGAVQIDWSNPLTRGLQCALSPYFEHAKQRRPTYSGTVAYSTRASGKSIDGNNAGLAYASVSGVGDPVTIMYAGSMTRSALTNVVAALGVSSGNQLIGFQFSSNAANNRIIMRQTNAGGVTFREYGLNVTTASAEKVVLCGVVTGSSSIDAYWNGKLDNGTLTTGSSGSNTSFNTAALGGVQRAANTYADTDNDGALFCYWNRALTASEIAAISAHPWQIFKPVTRTIGAVISGVTISRPNSDITVTGWTGNPDNVTLYANIDEAVASDTDFVISPALNATPGPAVFGLTQSLASGTYNVKTRARRTGASGQIRALLLDSGGATVGTGSWQSLTGSFATYNLSVTTSGTAARVRLEVQ